MGGAEGDEERLVVLDFCCFGEFCRDSLLVRRGFGRLVWQLSQVLALH
jgi:hypothetical protein